MPRSHRTSHSVSAARPRHGAAHRCWGVGARRASTGNVCHFTAVTSLVTRSVAPRFRHADCRLGTGVALDGHSCYATDGRKWSQVVIGGISVNSSAVELSRHHEPQNLSDRFALGCVKLLRFVADTFFAKRYRHRAVVHPLLSYLLPWLLPWRHIPTSRYLNAGIWVNMTELFHLNGMNRRNRKDC